MPVAPEKTGRRSPRRFALYALAGLVVVVVGVACAGPLMSRVEQPDYRVAAADGAIEVRDYGAMIAAEAEVRGDRADAIQEGFRLIAAYIFGTNRPRARIAMTAPVEQQAAPPSGQKIAMTAPVIQQASGQGAGSPAANGPWTVRFIMPREWTLETLPTPTDERVQLVPMPARRMVVIRFAGAADDALIAARTAELARYAREQGLPVIGAPVLAFYNPPWTLPFMRRNEIMFEVARP